MVYQLAVTDTTDKHELTHLTAAETRLSDVLAQPKRIALGCIVVLTAAGWLALALLSCGVSFGWDALCRPIAACSLEQFAVVLAMWAAMTLAMMLPTAGPMILTYAEIADTAARKNQTVVSPIILAAGYIAVWLAFAVAATLLQFALVATGALNANRLIAGLIFLAAGTYQFTRLKQACLTRCQRPFPFFFANWTTHTRGVFALGLRQGVYCLGCCWALMLIGVAVGTMNVLWMAALGAVMT